MFEFTITPDVLSYVLAGLMAIAFDWFPVLSTWYDGLSKARKQQVMAALLAVVILVVFGLGCAGVLAALSCDKDQVAKLISMYLIAIGINQGVHKISKPTAAG